MSTLARYWHRLRRGHRPDGFVIEWAPEVTDLTCRVCLRARVMADVRDDARRVPPVGF